MLSLKAVVSHLKKYLRRCLAPAPSFRQANKNAAMTKRLNLNRIFAFLFTKIALLININLVFFLEFYLVRKMN